MIKIMIWKLTKKIQKECSKKELMFDHSNVSKSDFYLSYKLNKWESKVINQIKCHKCVFLLNILTFFIIMVWIKQKKKVSLGNFID